MAETFLLIALPACVALVAACLSGWVRERSSIAGACIAALYFTGAVFLLAQIPNGGNAFFSVPWVSELGVDFSLRLTGFSAWFGVLILFLGGCVNLYACTYFKGHQRLSSLLILLGLFASAMLGVIWADNLYLIFLFWEATSLLSFLLVGFHNEKEISRANAAQAFLITMAGGAALLVGFVLLHLNLGSASLAQILVSDIADVSTAAVVFIMLGAMTKSAQWPFHFWLPNAMVGPTPVSAYLHSATMVKAGVFLLGTLAPLLSQNPIWTPVLAIAGVMTVGTAVVRGAYETDMKAILASTTLAALGFLTILAGLGTPAAMLGFVIFLTAHALYKAPLFLAAGNIEKRFGTRDLNQLRGAARLSPVTGAVVVVSALSLIGVAPLPGFLGKEYLLKAAWAYSPWLAIAVAISAVGVLALGFRLIIPMLCKAEETGKGKQIPLGMTLATLFPAIGALGMVAALSFSNHQFLGPAAAALGADEGASYQFWYGLTPALGLGMGALALSLLVSRVILRSRRSSPPDAFAPFFDQLFDNIIYALKSVAATVSGLLEEGKLVSHLIVMLIVIGMLSFFSIEVHDWPVLPLSWDKHSIAFLGLVPLLVISTVVASRTQKTITILVSLGFVGFVIALIFLWFSAPDLALTQLMAETLILFLLAGALMKVKKKESSEPAAFRLIFSIFAGALVTLLTLKSIALEWNRPISEFFLQESKTQAFGANVVNVILVDFRALDTLGEIIVLAIAAMGADAALGAARKRAPLPEVMPSSLLTSGARLLAFFLLPTILWIFWRGHNAPGGGFIGALLAAGGVGLGLLSSWRRLTPPLMRRYAHRLIISGLGIALVSALLAVFVGVDFFQGLWFHYGDLHLGTPLLFDLGVFLTVLGFCMNYLRHFHIRQIS